MIILWNLWVLCRIYSKKKKRCRNSFQKKLLFQLNFWKNGKTKISSSFLKKTFDFDYKKYHFEKIISVTPNTNYNPFYCYHNRRKNEISKIPLICFGNTFNLILVRNFTWTSINLHFCQFFIIFSVVIPTNKPVKYVNRQMYANWMKKMDIGYK